MRGKHVYEARCARPTCHCAPRRPHRQALCPGGAHLGGCSGGTPAALRVRIWEVRPVGKAAVVVYPPHLPTASNTGVPHQISGRALRPALAVPGAARGGRLLRWPWQRFGGQARASALRNLTRRRCPNGAPEGRAVSSTALAPGPVARRSRRSRPPQRSPHRTAPGAALRDSRVPHEALRRGMHMAPWPDRCSPRAAPRTSADHGTSNILPTPAGTSTQSAGPSASGYGAPPASDTSGRYRAGQRRTVQSADRIQTMQRCASNPGTVSCST